MISRSDEVRTNQGIGLLLQLGRYAGGTFGMVPKTP